MIEQRLVSAIESAWSHDTASSDNEWSAANPAVGHCDVTALVVRESVGGDLRMTKVLRGGEFSEFHYWNVLPDGTDVDLTSSQFDGDESFSESTLMDDEFFAAAGPINPALQQRLDAFRSAVRTHMGSDTRRC